MSDSQVPGVDGGGGGGGRRTRVATRADIPAIRAILAAFDNDGPIVTGDVVGPYVAHVVRHHRARVVEEGGRIVAFGAVAWAGPVAHLADLFVAPDRLGQGIGRPLLAELFSETEHRTTFASDDPRALPSYVRIGMAPLWPHLFLKGSAAQIPQLGEPLETLTATPARLAEIERRWTGHDRRLDHEHLASGPDPDPFLVVDEDGPVAVAHARYRQASPVRAVVRLVVRPEADPVQPILAAVRRAARGGEVQLGVPGPNPVLPLLLEAGFRIEERDTFMATDPSLVDPLRLLPNPGLL